MQFITNSGGFFKPLWGQDFSTKSIVFCRCLLLQSAPSLAQLSSAGLSPMLNSLNRHAGHALGQRCGNGSSSFCGTAEASRRTGVYCSKKKLSNKDQLYNNDIMSCCKLLYCMHIVTYEMT